MFFWRLHGLEFLGDVNKNPKTCDLVALRAAQKQYFLDISSIGSGPCGARGGVQNRNVARLERQSGSEGKVLPRPRLTGTTRENHSQKQA